MKPKEVTTEQFAQWLFEKDRDQNRKYPSQATFGNLRERDKELYLQDADFFIKMALYDRWPRFILDKLEKEQL